jgi:hypothetical protein
MQMISASNAMGVVDGTMVYVQALHLNRVSLQIGFVLGVVGPLSRFMICSVLLEYLWI